MSDRTYDINKLTNAIISLYAIVDSWCDVQDGTFEGKRLREALQEFILDQRSALTYLLHGQHPGAAEQIEFASALEDEKLNDLRKELRDLLYEYLCLIESAEGSAFLAPEKLSIVESLVSLNHKKVIAFEVPL